MIYSSDRLFVKCLLGCVGVLALLTLSSVDAFVVSSRSNQRRGKVVRGLVPLRSAVEVLPDAATVRSNVNQTKKSSSSSKTKVSPSSQKAKTKKKTSTPKGKSRSSKGKGSITKGKSFGQKVSRKERNTQYMVRRWKSQQAAQKKRKTKTQRKGLRGDNDGETKLVSAVGLKVGTYGNSNSGSNTQKSGKKRSTSKGRSVKTRRGAKKYSKSPSPNTSKSDLLSWTELIPGASISGKVLKVLPYGALVQTQYDIPGRTHGCAMLHISQISNEKIDDISKFVKVGDQIDNARVLSLNREEGKVALSLREKTQRAIPLETLRIGDEVEGKVVRMKQYGLFVDIGCRRNALLHISRISLYKVANLTDYANVGDTIKVRVIRLDAEQKNIAVSMLTPENDKYIDRRDLQRERVQLWQRIVNSEDNSAVDAKRQLLELDKVIWDEFFDGLDTPRMVEV